MPQSLPDSFHAIVDTVSCIMNYGFDILSDVFGHYNGIIGLKLEETRNLLLFFNINRYKGAFGGLVLSITANRTNKTV